MRIQIDHWPEALVAFFVVKSFNPFAPTPSVRNHVPYIVCDVISLRGKHLTCAGGRDLSNHTDSAKEAREQVNFKIDENRLALPMATRTSFHLILRSQQRFCIKKSERKGGGKATGKFLRMPELRMLIVHVFCIWNRKPRSARPVNSV